MGIVLVTGGAGFIGSHLVEGLLERGGEVRVLDNLGSGSLRNLQPAADQHVWPLAGDLAARPQRRLELMVGDVRDERLVRKAMRHVDCVFHFAAAAGDPGTPSAEVHNVNVQGTFNVLQAATAEGVRRVVFASCGTVYGAPGSAPAVEAQPPQPVTMFAASKLAAEIYCRAYDVARHVETVILRYFNVYGPREQGFARSSVSVLIDTLRHRRRPALEGDGRSCQDLVYVEDAVEAARAAAVVPGAAGRTFNIGGGKTVTALEMFDILSHLLRADTVPRFTRVRGSLQPPLVPAISLATEVLGWTPRISLVTGLARSLQYLTESEATHEQLLAEVGLHEERPDV